MQRSRNCCLSLSSSFTAGTAAVAARPIRIEGQELLSPMGAAAAEQSEVRLRTRNETNVYSTTRRRAAASVVEGEG